MSKNHQGGKKGLIISTIASQDEPPLIKKRFIKHFQAKSKKFFTQYKKQFKKFYTQVKNSLAQFLGLKNLKKLRNQIIILILSLILVFINSNNAYANDYLLKDILGKKQKIILGSNQEIIETTKEINKYLALNPKIKENKNKKNELKKFILKPLVLETKSRQHIEKEKKQKEIQTLAYTSYFYSNYDTYSRNIIARENIEQNNPNSYYYGYCTWYVASKKSVPSLWGNAGSWLNSAQISGYETSREAKDNAIIVTNESGWGHVGIVETVNENAVTISEMNYNGWGTVNKREIPKDSPIIKGFIY